MMKIPERPGIWTRIAATMFPLIACLPAAAEPLPLFARQQTMAATLEAPFRDIMLKRDQDNEYDGVLTYLNAAGEPVRLDVKLRVRGEFRARHDICDFAPLRLNFRKSQVAGTEFEEQDKIKLVTHCENSGTRYEQLLLKEYLAYQFLSQVTEKSFQTRLLKISYVDIGRNGKVREKYAFLIEHPDALALRLDARPVQAETVAFDELDPRQANLVSVFSYFIGNTDFAVVTGPRSEFCCHNAELFEATAGKYLPIPYDFDFSGMVNAPYANPSASTGLTNVRTRLYRGRCQNNDLLQTSFDLFRSKKNEILALVPQQEGLSNKTRKEMTYYIERFYETIDNDTLVQRNFFRKCSGPSAGPDRT